MQQVVIENPVLNSPFEEPKRHFRFTEDGITDEIIEERRISQYFVPIPRAKKKSPKQLSFETEWTADRVRKQGHQSYSGSSSHLAQGWICRNHKNNFKIIGILE